MKIRIGLTSKAALLERTEKDGIELEFDPTELTEAEAKKLAEIAYEDEDGNLHLGAEVAGSVCYDDYRLDALSLEQVRELLS